MLKIKELRQKKNLTIQELADKSGVSSSAIGNYENRTSDITLTKLLAIAEALEVNYWDLVELKGIKKESSVFDSKEMEAEISNSLESLAPELQIKILKLYLIENKKTIAALQNDQIENLKSDFSDLEEYVLNNIAILTGKSQANEYRQRLNKKSKEKIDHNDQRDKNVK